MFHRIHQLFDFSGEGQEVHAAAGRAQAQGHRVQLHVAQAHVRHLQSRRAQRIQGFQGKEPKSLFFFIGTFDRTIKIRRQRMELVSEKG